ncbi:hypothetical protein TNCV_2412631 [Trichonephila clavipes]|nr:hypothetical protein TNCV_2412631 [Trichonephila clavipes]
MADCEVEGTIASPLSIPLEKAMSPTEERRDEGRNIRTRQNPFGPQERQTRISKASHSLSSLLNYLRAFGDGHVAGVTGGQGIESWLVCLEFEPSATKDPLCRAAMHVKSIES